MNFPVSSLGQGWQVRLTSRSADERSATLPVTATARTTATEHLLWTTYSLSNSIAVSKAMICSWSFLYVLHNALELRNKEEGRPLNPVGEDPLITRKMLLCRWIQVIPTSSRRAPAPHPVGEGGDTQISYLTARFQKDFI